jgi:deoxyribonuclease IV
MHKPRRKSLQASIGPPRTGAHMSIAGGHHRAVEAALAVGCAALQVFTKSSNQWRAKPLADDQVAAFRAALAESGLAPAVGHNSYLINLGSPDTDLWQKSIDALTVEVERAEALGLSDLVIHPGSHVGSGERAGLTRIARALKQVERRTRGYAVIIDLETTAGQGSSLGHRFEHLARILDLLPVPERVGVCADTCHLFAAGYAMGSAEEYNNTIEALHRAVGVGRVRVWHVNDSQKPFGSRVDRHAGIGRGQMGLEPFRHLVNDTRFNAVPMVLETPKGTVDGENLDAINLRVLRRLWNGPLKPRVGASDVKQTLGGRCRT